MLSSGISDGGYEQVIYKDALALHLKLNELVAAVVGASNRLIEIEALSEDDLRVLERHYHELAKLARSEGDTRRSHSVDEARARHDRKSGPARGAAPRTS